MQRQGNKTKIAKAKEGKKCKKSYIRNEIKYEKGNCNITRKKSINTHNNAIKIKTRKR